MEITASRVLNKPGHPEKWEIQAVWRSHVLTALFRDKLTCLAFLFLTVIGLFAVASSLISPYDPAKTMLMSRLLPIGSFVDGGFHLLGTDEIGRDVLSRIIHGSRVTLAVAVGAVAVSGVIGVLMGLVAGYYGGRVDDLLMRVVDLTMAIPLLLLALVMLYILGPSTQNVVIVLGAIRWPLFARLTRSSTLSVKQEEFVLAAHCMGCRPRRVMFRHILPNLLTPILVVATLEVAANILTESTLSFLGMGIQPPDASWGLMLSAAQAYMFSHPDLIMTPGLVIFLTVLSINLVGSWLRMLNDPTQRWRLIR